MRIDKFLKVTRIIKRRSVATEACDTKRIQINNKVAKPSKQVKVGDIISICFGDRTVTIKVLSTSVYDDELMFEYLQ